MRWILVLVALATLSAGCFGGSKALSQEQAEEAAEDALRGFATSFAAADGGELTKVTGQFRFTAGSTGNADFVIEWGLQGSGYVKLDAGGAFGASIEIFCDDQATVLRIEEQAIEARPRPDKSCMQRFQDPGDPLDISNFDDLDLTSVTANGDGTVTASYMDEEGNVTIQIDRRHRVTRMEIDTESGEGFLRMDYDPRRLIAVPEADERMPAMINGVGRHDGQAYQWTGVGGQQTEPFDDFEVRIIDNGSGSVVATFPIGHDATSEGFVFTFSDDGDGVFGGDDGFTVTKDGWTSTGQYDVVVWDRWADRALGDYPIPGFEAWTALLLLGAVLVARR